MQLNSNTLSSENPNLSIIMEPHRSRRNKFKCEHVLFIVFIILIIAMLGSILHKQTKMNKKIEKLQSLVPNGESNFAWVPSLNGQVPQEAIPGKEGCNRGHGLSAAIKLGSLEKTVEASLIALWCVLSSFFL